MFFTKVRPKINKLYENYSKKKIHLYSFIDLLDDEPTLEELYQKMEDFKDFGEDINHMNMYNEAYHDDIFISSIEALQRRMDLSAIEVMMCFCNDKMHKLTPLRDHWIDAFDCGPLPDVFREMFTHLHKGLPQGREMLTEYFYWHFYTPEIEGILMETVLYARKDAFLELWDELEKEIERTTPYLSSFYIGKPNYEEQKAKYEEDKVNYEFCKALHAQIKDHYLKNHMRTVPCAAS